MSSVSSEQNMSDSQGQEQVGGQQKWEIARGRLGGGKRGEGGGNTQRQADKGGEGTRAGTRVGENKGKDKDNGNTQTEAPRNSNADGVRGGNNGKVVAGDRQATGSRVYRQDTRGTEPGPS